MEYSKLRMFFEIRYPSFNITEKKDDIIAMFDNEYYLKNIVRDELQFKKKEGSSELAEIKMGPKRFCYTMGLCPGYEYFSEVLMAHLEKVTLFLGSTEIFWMEVRGHHLCTISSLEEFFEVISSLSDYASLGFSDNGVSLSFQKENLNINIIYRQMERALAKEYFLSPDSDSIPELNLSIDIDVSLEETISPRLLTKTAKKHFKNATDLMQLKVENVFKTRSIP